MTRGPKKTVTFNWPVVVITPTGKRYENRSTCVDAVFHNDSEKIKINKKKNGCFSPGMQ